MNNRWRNYNIAARRHAKYRLNKQIDHIMSNADLSWGCAINTAREIYYEMRSSGIKKEYSCQYASFIIKESKWAKRELKGYMFRRTARQILNDAAKCLAYETNHMIQSYHGVITIPPNPVQSEDKEG